MAKYTVNQSTSTGRWQWACKDGSDEGWSDTKRGAKQAGKAACGIANVDIDPPHYEAEYALGALVSFTADDLAGNSVTHPVSDINEDEFDFFFGLTCQQQDNDVSDAGKAIAILKIWGIYRGGNTVTEIQEQHNLTTLDFNKLIAKDYMGLEITIEENEEIIWDFPA